MKDLRSVRDTSGDSINDSLGKAITLHESNTEVTPRVFKGHKKINQRQQETTRKMRPSSHSTDSKPERPPAQEERLGGPETREAQRSTEDNIGLRFQHSRVYTQRPSVE